MLYKYLSHQDKAYFLHIAHLLSLIDKPVLRDGSKPERSATPLNSSPSSAPGHTKGGNKDADKARPSGTGAIIGIQRGEPEAALLQEWSCDGDLSDWSVNRIEEHWLEKLRAAPPELVDDAVTRATLAHETLHVLLNERKYKPSSAPSVSKLMMFELMRLALADGNISNVEYHFLSKFKHLCQLDDYIFRDLLERAESTHREAQKTLALILE